MAHRLADKVALITGAGSGIGRATAELFAREGAAVAVVDVSPEGGEETVRRIRAADGDATFCRADVRSREEIAGAVAQAEARWGRLQVIFAHAGPSRPGAVLAEVSEADWDATVEGVLKSVYLTAKAGLPALARAGGGVFLATGASATHMTRPNTAVFAAAKAGVLALIRGIARDYADQGVRAAVVAPGPTDTPAWPLGPAGEALIQSRSLIRRVARPEEVAAAALFLASDEASLVTGSVLFADGGITIT